MWTEVQLHMSISDQLVRWIYSSDFYCCFQKWRKELAKNREKLLGGSDKDKEKDKKTTDKEKEEKKEKKEVWHLKHQTSEWSHSEMSRLTLAFHLCLEKKEREEEIQQGEERPPVVWWPAVSHTHTHTHTLCSSFVPLFNLLYYHVPVSKQANILKSNEPCFHCVSVKHSSSSSSSSSSDSSSSSSSDSEDEVSHFRPQTVMLDQP